MSEETASEVLARFEKLLEQARTLREAGRLDEAHAAAHEAMLLDEKNPRPLEALAHVAEARGRPEEAERLRGRAGTLRKEAWQRQVEAEIRGQHELWGDPLRHEP